MKLVDLYKLIVKKGIAKDPRTQAEIKSELKKAQKAFRDARGADKKAFDKEVLTNPFADTRILYGQPDRDIRTVMVGIDMEAPELLAADRLNERGAEIDLVMAHHPEGGAWARLYDVMGVQISILKKFGIPLEVGSRMLKDRMGEVSRSVAPANHMRSVDIARLLNMPFMCAHTPADNHVADFLQKLFDKRRPQRLSQALTLLKSIPEYLDGLKKNAGPRLLIGEPNKKVGKVFVDMTGGTEGPKKIYSRLSQAGVGTVIAMHLSEDHFRQAKDEHINVIIAGHIASDTLGLNLLLDEVENVEELKIISASGFVRVKR